MFQEHKGKQGRRKSEVLQKFQKSHPEMSLNVSFKDRSLIQFVTSVTCDATNIPSIHKNLYKCEFPLEIFILKCTHIHFHNTNTNNSTNNSVIIYEFLNCFFLQYFGHILIE